MTSDKKADALSHAERLNTVSGLPPGYAALVTELESRIRDAQFRARLAVNREMLRLYWHIGQRVVERQTFEGWRRSMIGRLARDLQAPFPA